MLKRLLSKCKLKDFDVIISQKLCCKSRKFNKVLMEGKVTDETLLEVEIFLRLECPEFYMLVRLYEDYCIRKAQDKAIIDDPTTQE